MYLIIDDNVGLCEVKSQKLLMILKENVFKKMIWKVANEKINIFYYFHNLLEQSLIWKWYLLFTSIVSFFKIKKSDIIIQEGIRRILQF